MKNRCIAVFAIVMGAFLLGSARAETWASKLADVVAVAAGDSEATSEGQAVAMPPANDAEQQAPKAEVRDAVNENAPNGQK